MDVIDKIDRAVIDTPNAISFNGVRRNANTGYLTAARNPAALVGDQSFQASKIEGSSVGNGEVFVRKAR